MNIQRILNINPWTGKFLNAYMTHNIINSSFKSTVLKPIAIIDDILDNYFPILPIQTTITNPTSGKPFKFYNMDSVQMKLTIDEITNNLV